MVRTQIYLTAEEREALRDIARRTGKKPSVLIRQAIDALIAEFQPEDRQARLRQARGLWGGRQDLPEWRSLRREFDRLAASGSS
jgi:predicted transcriptional regulator